MNIRRSSAPLPRGKPSNGRSLTPEDVEIIICATTTPDQIMPSTGALIQAQIGAVNAAGMDVFAACSGFLYGLTMVESMIKTGQIKYALVIGAEVLTKYVDYTDRGTCVIFGDGAGAAVVGPVPEGKGILATKIKSDGRYEEQLYAPGGGTKLGTTHQTIDEGQHFFKMKGNELFKVAVRSMADISAEMLEKAGFTVDDVDLVIPHQANQRITDAVASRSACLRKRFIRISPSTATRRRRRYRSRWTNVSSRDGSRKARSCC